VRAKPLSYRRGTLSALEYGALVVSGVINAVASEDITGLVTIFVSDGSGGSNPTMTGNVTTEERNWAAAGAAWQVRGGTLLEPAISLTVYTRPGLGEALTPAIQASIRSRLLKLRVGERMRDDMIEQATMNVDEGIMYVTLDAPVSPYPASIDLTALVRAGSITVAYAIAEAA
jgi:hypothetical protein